MNQLAISNRQGSTSNGQRSTGNGQLATGNGHGVKGKGGEVKKGDTGREESMERKGGESRKNIGDVVAQLEMLSMDMEVVKAYIMSLKKPLIDRCQSWIDGRMVEKILKISARTLKTMRDNGSLPYSRIGGKFYYKAEDLEETLQKNYSVGKNQGGCDE